MLSVLDVLCHILHLAVIFINLFCWKFPGFFRSLFLGVFSLTIISWIGFAYWFGLGYCFLTDYHWQIKRQLGEYRLPPSYIHYIFEEWLGLNIARQSIDIGVGSIFVALLVIYGSLIKQRFKL